MREYSHWCRAHRPRRRAETLRRPVKRPREPSITKTPSEARALWGKEGPRSCYLCGMPIPHPLPGAVLLGHGSSAPGAEAEIKALVAALSLAEPEWRFAHAFLNQEPSLEIAVGALAKAGCSVIRVLPLLVFTGKHVAEDIPNEIERLREIHPFIHFELEPHLSRLPGFSGVVLEGLRADVTTAPSAEDARA